MGVMRRFYIISIEEDSEPLTLKREVPGQSILFDRKPDVCIGGESSSDVTTCYKLVQFPIGSVCSYLPAT
jgi:hypothetical protein